MSNVLAVNDKGLLDRVENLREEMSKYPEYRALALSRSAVHRMVLILGLEEQQRIMGGGGLMPHQRLALIEQACVRLKGHGPAPENTSIYASKGIGPSHSASRNPENPHLEADSLLTEAVRGLAPSRPIYAMVIALRDAFGLPLA